MPKYRTSATRELCSTADTCCDEQRRRWTHITYSTHYIQYTVYTHHSIHATHHIHYTSHTLHTIYSTQYIHNTAYTLHSIYTTHHITHTTQQCSRTPPESSNRTPMIVSTCFAKTTNTRSISARSHRPPKY